MYITIVHTSENHQSSQEEVRKERWKEAGGQSKWGKETGITGHPQVRRTSRRCMKWSVEERT